MKHSLALVFSDLTFTNEPRVTGDQTKGWLARRLHSVG